MKGLGEDSGSKGRAVLVAAPRLSGLTVLVSTAGLLETSPSSKGSLGILHGFCSGLYHEKCNGNKHS